MTEVEQLRQRVDDLERRLRRAQGRANDAWNIALGAVFLAVLFRFGIFGVLIGVAVLLLLAKARQMTR